MGDNIGSGYIPKVITPHADPYVVGDILYAGSTEQLSKLNIGDYRDKLSVSVLGIPEWLPGGEGCASELSQLPGNAYTDRILSLLVIPANTLSWALYDRRVIRIKAAGTVYASSKAKKIKIIINDQTNNVVVAQNNVTTSPNGLPWTIEATITHRNAPEHSWYSVAHVSFNGIAPEINVADNNNAGTLIKWDTATTLMLTGEVAFPGDPAGGVTVYYLSWTLEQT